MLEAIFAQIFAQTFSICRFSLKFWNKFIKDLDLKKLRQTIASLKKLEFMNAKKLTVLSVSSLLFGAVFAENNFGGGSLNLAEGTVVDSKVDGSGAEIGAGLAGGGAEVSGQGESSVLDSSSLTISGGTVYGIAMGGSYAKNGAAATISGDSSVVMTSGNVLYKDPNTSPYDAVILGGGFAYATDGLSASSDVLGYSKVVIDGGYTYYAAGGSASQDEGVNATSKVHGQSSLILNGGTVDYGAYGAGWSLGANSKSETLGGTYVEVNSGASVTWNLFGAGGAWGGGTTSVDGGTQVIIDGGTIGGSVLGGGEAEGASNAIVTGGTDVQLKSGYAKYVYGGGANWDLEGSAGKVSVDSAKVTISGGEVGSYVVGGGYYSDVENLANVEVTGGTVNGNIYGGSEGAGSTGSTLVNISGGEIKGSVYGGGTGANATVLNDTNVNISGGVSLQEAWGGGNAGSVVNGSTHISVDGNSSVYYVMGGSNGNSEIKGSTFVNVNNATVNTVYGAGWAENGASEKILGGTNVHIGANTVFADPKQAAVYGGGWASGAGSSSVIEGATDVKIDGGALLSVFGGGSVGDNAQATLNGGSYVTVNGGKIWTVNGGNYVYQSGSTAVNGDVSVVMNSGEVSQVYGGSWVYAENASASDVIDGNISVKINGGTVTNDFGGDGIVVGASIVQGAAKADVKGSVSLEISNGATVTSNVYGGGYSKDSTGTSTVAGDVSLVISDASIAGDIYAGGYGAGSDVKGSADVTFVGDASKLNFSGTVYGSGANGSSVEGGSVVSFGSDDTAFVGSFNANISGFQALTIENSASSVSFANAFEVVVFSVASDASVSLVEGTSFSELNIVFSEDFTSGGNLDFDLADVFGDSATIVESALSSDSKFTVTNADGDTFIADYNSGSINIGAAVPEPATWAAIAGALALAFAAYRRRA